MKDWANHVFTGYTEVSHFIFSISLGHFLLHARVTVDLLAAHAWETVPPWDCLQAGVPGFFASNANICLQPFLLVKSAAVAPY